MRLIRTAASVVVFLTVIAGVWKIASRQYSPSDEKERGLRLLVGPKTGVGAALRHPLRALPEYLASSGLTQECQEYVKHLEAVDLTVQGSLQIPAIPQPGSECNIEDASVAEAEKSYIKACFLKNLSKDAFVDTECVRSLLVLRSAITALLTQKKTLLTDSQTLGRLVFFYWGEREKNPSVKPRLLWAAKALDAADLKQDISRRVIIRTEAESLLANGSKMSPEAREAEWKRLDEIVGNDMDDLAVWVKTRGFDEHRMSKLSGEILSANPDATEGLLLSAFALWKKAEYAEAFEVLKRASKDEKEGERFMRILKALTHSGAGEEVFLQVYQLDLKHEDFDR